MTISSTDDPRAGPFNGNGSQTAFPFEFKAFAEEDLLVVQTDEDGLETTLVLDSDYSVTLNADQNADPGGTVTAMVAPPTGETLTIVSNLEFIQETDITNGGGFYPEVIETQFDRNVMLVKQVNEKVGRALQLAISTPDEVDGTLPAPVAQKIIGWNDSGTGLVNRDITDFATVVAFAAWQSQTFDGDGVTTAFTLSSDPGNINNLDIAISGVTQTPDIDFTLSGVTLTFLAAPPAGTDNVFARWGQALPQGESDASQVTFEQSGTGAVERTAQEKMRDVFDARDFGASPSASQADNRVALQLAIAAAAAYATASGNTATVLIRDNYGRIATTPSTYPDLTGVTAPVRVEDWSKGNTYAGFPTAYDGSQKWAWSETPQTTSPGQHDGNLDILAGAWAPNRLVFNTMNLTGARAATDNRRARFGVGWNGYVAWGWGQGATSSATQTDEELADFIEQKHSVPGDTLGDFFPRVINRKTGRISYGGGTTAPSAAHHFYPCNAAETLEVALFQGNDSIAQIDMQSTSGSGARSFIRNNTGNTEIGTTVAGVTFRQRQADGYLALGGGSTFTYNFNLQAARNSNYVAWFDNTSATDGFGVRISSGAASATSFSHLECYSDGNTVRKAAILGNGNLVNANNSYGAISDRKLKQDIVDSGSQWGDVKALRLRKYRFKSDPTGPLQLGFIAQEVEQTSPGLVGEVPDRDDNNEPTGEVTKTVANSIALLKAFGALQEAMHRIEALEAEVRALKGNP